MANCGFEGQEIERQVTRLRRRRRGRTWERECTAATRERPRGGQVVVALGLSKVLFQTPSRWLVLAGLALAFGENASAASRVRRKAPARSVPVSILMPPEASPFDLKVGESARLAIRNRSNVALVAMDPWTGRVLTIGNPQSGLFTAYQPCSVFKLVVAVAGLTERVITLRIPFQLHGRLQYQARSRPHRPAPRSGGVVQHVLRVGGRTARFRNRSCLRRKTWPRLSNRHQSAGGNRGGRALFHSEPWARSPVVTCSRGQELGPAVGRVDVGARQWRNHPRAPVRLTPRSDRERKVAFFSTVDPGPPLAGVVFFSDGGKRSERVRSRLCSLREDGILRGRRLVRVISRLSPFRDGGRDPG